MLTQENPEPSRPDAVYRLFDEAGGLLYIGSAYDPDDRCKAHQDAEWWPRVVRREEQWHPTRAHAYVMEMRAIKAEGPRHNVMGTPSYGVPDTAAVRHCHEEVVRVAECSPPPIAYAAR